MSDATPRCLLPPPIVAANPIELRAHGDFVQWLAGAGGTLAVTTYNSGKLAFFSAASGKLTASFWRLPRPMGLAVSRDHLAIASQAHIWVLRTESCGSSTLGIEMVYTTGRLDAHDLAFDRRGLVFANTRFNCISRPSDRVNFVRAWQPAFVDKAVRRDCCHLNGLGIRGGRVALATAFCESGAPAAWRAADRYRSGVILDVRENRTAASGLCMPHSPRWHAGRWWFCDSGRGSLCTFDGESATVEPVAVLPGFTRGLVFGAGRAIVGLSRIRKRHILDAPPVRERFRRMRSGLWLVDPASGRQTGALEFTGGGREVYDVAFLPNSLCPD
jgi:uncharacterized protein (TIGR03032 family)